MKKIILTFGLLFSSVFAIDLGLVLISPEAGATLSYNKANLYALKNGKTVNLDNKDHFNAGAYARLWIGIAGFMIAPQVKYDYLKVAVAHNRETVKSSLHNIQYGGVIGYRIPFIKLTPFIGASYSTFKGKVIKTLKNTYAINFGARWEVPLIPLLTIGFEGSWQKPDFNFDKTILRKANFEMLNLGATIGLAF